MAHRLVRPLRGTLAGLHQWRQPKITNSVALTTNSIRNYISEMRKEAFEGNILRLLRNEIQYEFDRSPPSEPVPEFNSFIVDERPGEQWIRLKKKNGEGEEIKVDATMFDDSVPTKKSGGDAEDDERLHITMIVSVFKEGSDDVLEFVCSVWPDTIELRRVFTRGRDRTTKHPYTGRVFKDKDEDDELREELYGFLKERGVNDELAIFLHKYMRNKDKTEFIRWMDSVKSFIEKKQKR
ncbi:OLC1v1014602C1 [Oldenlandia corymbosa var. corymbosa]|uniref:OLC1v1014602C1 n=1 Tax=Oldenlandia corymbosa var. corymbosa TaxID=529605 RepID=A0AAV1E3L5_OLDCO|nr:OLC1v1014602C1 [Oldenlandia corymbosa var. corymbosa]